MRWEAPESPRHVDRVGSAALARCENCKMTIDHEPYRKGGLAFCCDGCAYGGPCVC